jgi:hypothetical protein
MHEFLSENIYIGRWRQEWRGEHGRLRIGGWNGEALDGCRANPGPRAHQWLAGSATPGKAYGVLICAQRNSVPFAAARPWSDSFSGRHDTFTTCTRVPRIRRIHCAKVFGRRRCTTHVFGETPRLPQRGMSEGMRIVPLVVHLTLLPGAGGRRRRALRTRRTVRRLHRGAGTSRSCAAPAPCCTRPASAFPDEPRPDRRRPAPFRARPAPRSPGCEDRRIHTLAEYDRQVRDRRPPRARAARLEAGGQGGAVSRL